MSLASTSPFALAASVHRHSPGVPALLGRLLRWLDAWKDRSRLQDLSDHTLRDMGFTRDQIDAVLRGAVRRPAAATASSIGSPPESRT